MINIKKQIAECILNELTNLTLIKFKTDYSYKDNSYDYKELDYITNIHDIIKNIDDEKYIKYQINNIAAEVERKSLSIIRKSVLNKNILYENRINDDKITSIIINQIKQIFKNAKDYNDDIIDLRIIIPNSFSRILKPSNRESIYNTVHCNNNDYNNSTYEIIEDGQEDEILIYNKLNTSFTTNKLYNINKDNNKSLEEIMINYINGLKLYIYLFKNYYNNIIPDNNNKVLNLVYMNINVGYNINKKNDILLINI